MIANLCSAQTDGLVSIRNHGGVPDIDEDAFYLDIGGLVKTPVRLSMKDLKDESKFP